MAEGKTYWLALDARWLQREGVVEVRQEVGHAGVTALLVLMAQAKLENDGGWVRSGYRALAAEAFLDGPDEARNILAACVSGAVLDDFEEDADGKRFSCRLSGWQADQFKGRDAHRKAAKRADTETHDAVSGAVRTSPVPVGRGEERREEETPHGEFGEDARELFGYWQERCGHQKAKATPERLRAIRARLRDGYSVADVRRAIDGAATGAYVDDRGKRHDDLTLICRNGSKLEDFIARASAKAPPPPGSDGLRFDREALLAQEASNREARAAREAMYAQEVPA